MIYYIFRWFKNMYKIFYLYFSMIMCFSRIKISYLRLKIYDPVEWNLS